MPNLPKNIKQGDAARLFPVLSETSKEGRTTSILLACVSKVDELGRDLLAGIGQRVGARAKIETFTEVVFEAERTTSKDRPDGLILLTVGSRRWTALVEAKVASSELQAEQIERYRQLARDNGVDCVITISNQFATSPENHPLAEVRKSRSRIPVFHWSWMHILTTVDLLLSQDGVSDSDQRMLLNELRRFLSHPSAGVKGFDRMPREWSDLCKLVASGGDIPARSDHAKAVVEAWHQETRDLSLILSRMTGTRVVQKLPRKEAADPVLRQKADLEQLSATKHLAVALAIEDAAAPLEITADLARRSIDVGMSLKAPEDKKSAKARMNWLLRQVAVDDVEDLHVRLSWPGRSAQTQHSLCDLKRDPALAGADKEGLAPTSFFIFEAKKIGSRFAQQGNFVTELETIVPHFYGAIGAKLVAWQKPAPRVREGRDSSEDVSASGLAGEADAFEATSD